MNKTKPSVTVGSDMFVKKHTERIFFDADTVSMSKFTTLAVD